MDDQQNNDHDSSLPHDKAELLERIQRSRSTLEGALSSLNEEQLLQAGPSGWSIKDHLAHLATWELGIVELLRHRPRFAAMQIEEAITQGKSEEEINDLIYQRHAKLSLSEVMNEFRTAHQQMLQTLGRLADEDLFKPYLHYLPEGSEGRQDPVINWIIGNTYEHFDEHHSYIRALLK
jgi:hypothetical protein